LVYYNLTEDFSIIFNPPVFFEDFEGGLSKWETKTGLWNLTGDNSIWKFFHYFGFFKELVSRIKIIYLLNDKIKMELR